LNAVIAGNFVLAAAYYTHDTCHGYVSHNKYVNKFIAWLNGNVFFGMDPSFWKQEHDDHHASTNTYDGETGLIFDKQGKYHYWCQALELLEAFPAQFMIKFQQYTALPMQLFLGKTGLLIQNWVEDPTFKRKWTI